MKKIIPFLITAIILSSCSHIENTENAKQIENVNKVPVANIYEGYEELQGKKYGDVFTMPDRIERQEITKIYTFKLIENQCFDNLTDGKNFFRDFFGNEYNESFCSTDNVTGRLKYKNDAIVSIYDNGHVEAYKKNYEIYFGSTEGKFINAYKPSADGNKEIVLEGGNCKIHELCETVDSFCKKMFSSVYKEYEIIPAAIVHYYTDSGKKQAEFVCQLRYNGIPLEDYFSPLFEEKPGSTSKESILTYYIPTYILFELEDKGNIQTVFTGCYPRKVDSKEVEKIIPLKEAVNILKNELASYSKYKFEEVSLMYCCKVTSKTSEYAATEKRESEYATDPVYEPTWCFFWNTSQGGYGRQAIKVNAVTGEITLDMNLRG